MTLSLQPKNLCFSPADLREDLCFPPCGDQRAAKHSKTPFPPRGCPASSGSSLESWDGNWKGEPSGLCWRLAFLICSNPILSWGLPEVPLPGLPFHGSFSRRLGPALGQADRSAWVVHGAVLPVRGLDQRGEQVAVLCHHNDSSAGPLVPVSPSSCRGQGSWPHAPAAPGRPMLASDESQQGSPEWTRRLLVPRSPVMLAVPVRWPGWLIPFRVQGSPGAAGLVFYRS